MIIRNSSAIRNDSVILTLKRDGRLQRPGKRERYIEVVKGILKPVFEGSTEKYIQAIIDRLNWLVFKGDSRKYTGGESYVEIGVLKVRK